jgi:hypothetical protein
MRKITRHTTKINSPVSEWFVLAFLWFSMVIRCMFFQTVNLAGPIMINFDLVLAYDKQVIESCSAECGEGTKIWRQTCQIEGEDCDDFPPRHITSPCMEKHCPGKIAKENCIVLSAHAT